MANVSFLKVILPISIGFGLNSMSRGIAAHGDLAKLQGDNAGALSGHLAALLIVIAAAICFIYAGRNIYLGLRGRGDAPPPEGPIERVIDPVDQGRSEEAFDADAIMARYLAKRGSGAPEASSAAPQPAPALAPRPAFGRKRG